ncbi:MAG: flagellar type III secretion system protein FlhB [Planctomycetota bacterium]
MAEFEDKEQKTEEATPRRREEAREKGQVALSSELVSAVALGVGLAALLVAGGALVEAVGELLVESLAALPVLGTEELSVPGSSALVRTSLLSVAGVLLMVTLPAVAIGALAGYGQVGFRVTPKAVELDPARVDPVKGFSRLFGARSLVRTLMAAAKVLLIVTAVAVIAWRHLPEIVALSDCEVGPLVAGVGHIALRCVAGALGVILALALLDLAFQRHQHGKDLRMTRQEVKEEYRLTDGDPHVRARIRQLQRQMAMRRMMDDVPKSTVVVTNPEHYAVALRYDRDAKDAGAPAAPIVTAKGADHLARRIKEVARAAGVVLYEDVPLARALYAQGEVGREIPEGLYAAVAIVIGYVYRLRGLVARTPAGA